MAAKFNLCNGDASGQWQCCSPGLMQLADLEPHSELKNSSILLNKLPSFIFHFTFWYFCDKVSTVCQLTCLSASPQAVMNSGFFVHFYLPKNFKVGVLAVPKVGLVITPF